MKSAIAALALGAVGASAFVTPNAVFGRVATRSTRQVCVRFVVWVFHKQPAVQKDFVNVDEQVCRER